VLGIMGIWVSTTSSLQIDPPEALLMTQKRITLAMVGADLTLVNCRMFNGVVQSAMREITTLAQNGELQVMIPEGL
jgi:methylthioribose-1-phosphate isomerase